MQLDASDFTAILAKMAAGEFIVAFVVKGDGGSTPDQIECYPKDKTPMSPAATQNFLGGFLARHPVPNMVGPDGQVVLDATTGKPVPAGTPLQHFVEWLRAAASEQSRLGLADLAAQQIGDPAP